MSIKTFGGISYITSGNTAAIVISRDADGGVATPTAKSGFSEPEINECSQSDWAWWGKNNDLPNKVYADYMKNVGVLSSAIDIIARIAIGRGPRPVQVINSDENGQEQIKLIKDPEISKWARLNDLPTYSYNTILDALKGGLTVTQMLSNKAGDRVNLMKRTDASLCRYEKRDPKTGAIKNVYISYEWGKGGVSVDSKYVSKVRLLDRDYPMKDLTDRNGTIKKLPPEFAVTSHYGLYGQEYYPVPLWWSVRKWCDIAKGVPEMKAHMFNNQMTIKYTVEISNEYWEARFPDTWGNSTPEEKEAKREQVLKEFDKWLSGNENAYKTLIIPTKLNVETGEDMPLIKVTPLKDPIQDGKFLPDSAAANSEILFALALNPALLGVNMPGSNSLGGTGGSNIREAYLVQILIREVERQFAAKPLNLVSEINGWTKKYPDMEWRFPNHYLTTLDSGKNAKPIM